jgi:UDPglucose 6-dehydrogenase
MGLDHRIGSKFLHAGPGYGGSCLPKDTKALIKIFQDNQLTARIVEAVVQVNDAQKSNMVKKIRDALGGNEYGKTIAVMGLTFKPETDDMRDSPALTIIPALVEGGAEIRATDPQGMEEAKKSLQDVNYFDDPYEAARSADAILILTEWNEFRALDLEKLRNVMRGNLFIDLRNIYRVDVVQGLDFQYVGVGV